MENEILAIESMYTLQNKEMNVIFLRVHQATTLQQMNSLPMLLRGRCTVVDKMPPATCFIINICLKMINIVVELEYFCKEYHEIYFYTVLHC